MTHGQFAAGVFCLYIRIAMAHKDAPRRYSLLPLSLLNANERRLSLHSRAQRIKRRTHSVRERIKDYMHIISWLAFKSRTLLLAGWHWASEMNEPYAESDMHDAPRATMNRVTQRALNGITLMGRQRGATLRKL